MSGKKIIIESHIPFVGREFDGVACVERLAPEEITAAAVADADALIVRTRTRCDAGLLEGSRIGFVATATIGTDHIDREYCASRGIQVVSAPGCNAPAVAQYVWASVLSLRKEVRGMTIGIVGLGHVGSIVAEWGRRLGVNVLACDPPRQRAGKGWNPLSPSSAGSEPFVALSEIAARADIITFHTPHTMLGPDATHHLGNDAFFASLRRQPLLINAARGPVIDTEAILRASDARKLSELVIDCWEGEPDVDGRLLSLAAIATPHIAGYSVEGKQRATAATVAAALRYFGAPAALIESIHAPVASTGVEITPEAILASYDPMADTAALKSHPGASVFEQLRNGYPLRHELGFTGCL